LWDSSIVPFGEQFIKLDGQNLLEADGLDYWNEWTVGPEWQGVATSSFLFILNPLNFTTVLGAKFLRDTRQPVARRVKVRLAT